VLDVGSVQALLGYAVAIKHHPVSIFEGEIASPLGDSASRRSRSEASWLTGRRGISQVQKDQKNPKRCDRQPPLYRHQFPP
jgi:hypothetical protein